jgi:hypothetical protein
MYPDGGEPIGRGEKPLTSTEGATLKTRKRATERFQERCFIWGPQISKKESKVDCFAAWSDRNKTAFGAFGLAVAS